MKRVPSAAPLFSAISRDLDASLLSVITIPALYKFHNLRIRATSKCEGESPLFSPVIGQFTPGFNEERYNSDELILRYHELPDAHAQTSPVTVMLFTDPLCPVEVNMEVDWIHSLGTFTRSFVHVLVAPSFAIALLAHAVQIMRWRSSGEFPLLHNILSELLWRATPVGIPLLVLTLILEYFHVHLTWPLRLVELVDHSYTLMVPPWPSLLHLLALHLLAFTGVWLWSALCHVLLFLPARIIQCATSADKPFVLLYFPSY